MARFTAGALAGRRTKYVVLVFWLLGLCAVIGPAWRAASISPATATRST